MHESDPKRAEHGSMSPQSELRDPLSQVFQISPPRRQCPLLRAKFNPFYPSWFWQRWRNFGKKSCQQSPASATRRFDSSLEPGSEPLKLMEASVSGRIACASQVARHRSTYVVL